MSGGPINYNSPINFLLPQRVPEGIPEELRGYFEQLFNSMQQFILALVNNCGIGPQLVSDWSKLNGIPDTILCANMGRFYVKATENISFGAMVNLADDGAGNISARNANATDGTKPCHAFCSTSTGINAGDIGEVIVGRGLANIGSLTVGQNYWLSTTSALIQNGPPTAAGNIEQHVGVALSTTVLLFNVGGWIRH